MPSEAAPFPQANPKATYQEHASAIIAAVTRVLESGIYILGEEVTQFEREFAAFLGVRETVAVGSGTDALALALRGFGVGNGDLVITTSNTAVATVSAIYQAGAEPLLVDVDPETFTLDPNHFERALDANRSRVKAVIPVHLYGHPVALQPILNLAREHKISVLEDCAQSHGASLDNRLTGTWGEAAAFSFYPTKNLGALGDAGAITTNDPQLAARLRMLRQYGWQERYISQVNGINTRMDPVQAAILRVLLPHLESFNVRRRKIATRYSEGLAGLPLHRPVVRPEVIHAFHQYTIRCPNRPHVQKALAAAGIPSAVLYPVPIHLQPAYKDRINIGPLGLKETERAAGEILSLPLFPQLAVENVARVIAAIRSALE